MVGREARWRAADALAVTEETSAAVLPRRDIFLSRRVSSGRVGSLKGGLRRPSLEIMNFWFEIGTESSDATDSERFVIVAEEGKEKVRGAPWYVMVMETVSGSSVELSGGFSVAISSSIVTD